MFKCIGHWRGFKEFPTFDQAGIIMITQIIDQAGAKFFYGFGIIGILCEVLHLVGILLHIIEFLPWALPLGMLKERFHLGVLTVRNDPSLGWAGILVGQGHEGLIFQQSKTWFFWSIEKIRISKGPSV